MADRFAPKEAIGLYGVVLAGSFVFFVLGVYVGKEFRPLPVPPPETSQTTDLEAGPELGLYETLVPEGGVEAPQSGTADRPPAGTQPAGRESAAEGKPAGAEPAGADEAQPVPVSAEPVAPARDPAASSAGTRAATRSAPLPETYFTVQVAALTTRDEASQIVLRLDTKDYPSQVVPPEPGNRYFRVWVGEAITRAEADRLAARLRADGFHTYVKPVRRVTPDR